MTTPNNVWDHDEDCMCMSCMLRERQAARRDCGTCDGMKGCCPGNTIRDFEIELYGQALKPVCTTGDCGQCSSDEAEEHCCYTP